VYIVTGTTAIVPGTWYLVAITATNSGSTHLYVNNAEEGTPSSITTLWAGGDRYTLGTGSGGGFAAYTGVVDEIRYYNRALSLSEIQSIYAGGASQGGGGGGSASP
jgi:hypothetical protein